ncbi:MAG: hypothetical protein WDN28_21385 [Chthoniobacter sp.]
MLEFFIRDAVFCRSFRERPFIRSLAWQPMKISRRLLFCYVGHSTHGGVIDDADSHIVPLKWLDGKTLVVEVSGSYGGKSRTKCFQEGIGDQAARERDAGAKSVT